MTTITLAQPFMNETVWGLDGYLVNLTGRHLRDAASELGFTFTSKTKADAIRQTIREHYETAVKAQQEAPPWYDMRTAEEVQQQAAKAWSDQIEEDSGRIMPLHYAGRAMGAKHYSPTMVYELGGPVARRDRVVPGAWKIRAARAAVRKAVGHLNLIGDIDS